MTTSTPHATSAILLSDDMIFTSRIVGTGRCLGLCVAAAPNAERLFNEWAKSDVKCLILDLQNPGFDVQSLVQQLQEHMNEMPFLVAYGSHVDTASLKKARDAGCDVVLPRSKFVEDLPTALVDWCAGRTTNA